MEGNQIVNIKVKVDEEFKKELDTLNTKIFDLANTLVKARKDLLDGEVRYKNEEIMLINNISLETDDNNKKLYTNENQRKQRFLELMGTGHPLATLKKQLCEDREKLELKENEYQFLLRSFTIFDLTTRK